MAEGEANKPDEREAKPVERAQLSGKIPEKPEKPKEHVPFRRPAKLPENPRRVRGGLKLQTKEGEAFGWITQRLLRVVEAAASGDAFREGMEYARQGQTRRLDFEDGEAKGSVQGRRQRPYVTKLHLAPFTGPQKEALIDAMASQAIYAAKLLAAELPPNIEDVFAPHGLKLFPTHPEEFKLACSCREAETWCKHTVCLAALAAEKLQAEPLLLFDLRGLPGQELIDHLRERRALAGQGPGAQPVHRPHVAGVSTYEPRPIEECGGDFWSMPPDAELPAALIQPPDIKQPLLRRLGPSPFEGRFPLVGLLATCYEIVGDSAIAAAHAAGDDDAGDDGAQVIDADPAS
ncbi:MAG: hypothetical protein AAGI17_01665 [Planctomycetota bacterium]